MGGKQVPEHFLFVIAGNMALSDSPKLEHMVSHGLPLDGLGLSLLFSFIDQMLFTCALDSVTELGALALFKANGLLSSRHYR